MAAEEGEMDNVNEMESPQGKAADADDFGHGNTGLNKYTLVCALLASTNSILLGYGKFTFIWLFYFLFTISLNLSRTHEVLFYENLLMKTHKS